ncbi:UNVERIFIED_CONTAM: hypothetical protein ABID98_002339 [Brevibacillus sp. OAP136]
MGARIEFTVQFNGIVTVTGVPTLSLNNGATASYIGGSGTDTLTFRYNVQPGDSSVDLGYTSINSLSLGGGTIKGLGNVDATLTLPPEATFTGSHAIVIDTTKPTAYVSVSNERFIGLTFSEDIVSVEYRDHNTMDTPVFGFDASTNARYATISLSTTDPSVDQFIDFRITDIAGNTKSYELTWNGQLWDVTAL